MRDKIPNINSFLPNPPDLQLRLDPRVLGLQSLVGHDGADGTACPHVVEHDVLKREKGCSSKALEEAFRMTPLPPLGKGYQQVRL